MTTTNDMQDRYEDAERGLEWLEKLEALQTRSASNRAAFEVAEYVLKLRSSGDGAGGGPVGVGAGARRSGRRRRRWWRSFGRRGTATTGTRGSGRRC